MFRPDKELAYNFRLLRFLSSSGVSVVLNMIALHYLTANYAFDPFITQLCLIPPIVVFNFAASKYWSFSED